MFTYEVTYEDFNEPPQQVKETLYFNLTKAELIKMQTSVPGGMQQVLQDIVDAKDIGGLIKEFDKILLAAYGIRSEDGKKFTKSAQLREEFEASGAYDAVFQMLVGDDRFAADFVLGTFPKDMDLESILNEAKGQLPPPTQDTPPL